MDIVMLSAKCGQHHNAQCRTCQAAEETNDRRLADGTDEITRLNKKLALIADENSWQAFDPAQQVEMMREYAREAQKEAG